MPPPIPRLLVAILVALPGGAARLVAVLLPLAIASCGGNDAPRWNHLARRDSAPTLRFTAKTIPYPDAGDGVQLVARETEAWLEIPVARAQWESLPLPGLWRAPLDLHLVGHAERGGTPYRFTAGAREFTASRAHDLTAGSGARKETGTFYVEGATVLLRLKPDEEPPDRAVLAMRAGDLSTPEVSRIRGRRFSGTGFPVWPGQELAGEVEFPADATLRFATCVEPILRTAPPDAPPLVFRVRVDGETVLEHAEPDPSAFAFRWHQVPLPAAGGSAVLSFEVDGPLALTTFLDPVLGPRDVGRPGKRPWGTSRPDIVVFLADTFRADNLTAYGGDLDLTPHLDRLAAEGRCFRRAWSPGTYTLPGHTSLFTGLFPLQAGIRDMKRAVPDELTTIAEHLAEWGYRTGAVTDSGIVSQRFGMDQGFAWFDEEWTTLASTVERTRAFLDADDGRPVFLFVQTYRTHMRYQVSDETRAKHGARLGIEGDIDALAQTLRTEATRQGIPHAEALFDIPRGFEWTDSARDALHKMQAYYRGGVIDLDLGFAELRNVLAAHGLFEDGYLVFTSDHGEAFLEHDEAFHGGTVFGEQIRVPLVIAGKDIAPGTVDHAATLVDLAPTLAAMAGTVGRPEWLGTSLLTLDHDRPAFSFECRPNGTDSTVAIIEGGRKIIAFDDPEAMRDERFLGAFDLDADPGEHRPIADPAATWPAPFFRRLRPLVETLVEPLVGPQAAQLDQEKLAELRAMGYGGDRTP